MITIERVPTRRQIDIKVTDILDPAEVPSFIDEYRNMLSGAEWHSLGYTILIDATRAVVQPRDVADAFKELVQSSNKKARRIALAVSSQLLALQAKRVFDERDDTAVFDRVEDAQAWLDGQ